MVSSQASLMSIPHQILQPLFWYGIKLHWCIKCCYFFCDLFLHGLNANKPGKEYPKVQGHTANLEHYYEVMLLLTCVCIYFGVWVPVICVTLDIVLLMKHIWIEISI